MQRFRNLRRLSQPFADASRPFVTPVVSALSQTSSVVRHPCAVALWVAPGHGSMARAMEFLAHSTVLFFVALASSSRWLPTAGLGIPSYPFAELVYAVSAVAIFVVHAMLLKAAFWVLGHHKLSLGPSIAANAYLYGCIGVVTAILMLSNVAFVGFGPYVGVSVQGTAFSVDCYQGGEIVFPGSLACALGAIILGALGWCMVALMWAYVGWLGNGHQVSRWGVMALLVLISPVVALMVYLP